MGSELTADAVAVGDVRPKVDVVNGTALALPTSVASVLERKKVNRVLLKENRFRLTRSICGRRALFEIHRCRLDSTQRGEMTREIEVWSKKVMSTKAKV